jgi:DNA polymerase-1
MLYLVDASVFIFRAYYSVPIAVTDRDGQPVNALHGFARFLGELLERVRPEYVGVAFDESLAISFRNRICPSYKANRERPPVELTRQFERCRSVCAALGILGVMSGEYEADDVIGTLAAKMRIQGKRAVLITRDKDLAQLIRPGDEYWDYIADHRYGYEEIPARFGVKPECIADFLALTGDAVDNIRGVPGIGKRTASALLQKYTGLDHIYENLVEIGQLKMRNAAFVAAQLKEHREAAFLARRLTGIACDLPLAVELSDLRRRRVNLEALTALYDAALFGPLLRRQAQRLATL